MTLHPTTSGFLVLTISVLFSNSPRSTSFLFKILSNSLNIIVNILKIKRLNIKWERGHLTRK